MYLDNTKIVDLTEMQFGNLIVLGFDYKKYNESAERVKNGEIKSVCKYWICKCIKCEKECVKSVKATHLKSGAITYGGCDKGKNISSSKINNRIKRCLNGESFADGIKSKYGDVIKNVWDYEKNLLNPYAITASDSKKEIWIKCDSHGSYQTSPHNYMQGKRCPVCCNKKVLLGVNDVATTHPDVTKFLFNKEDAHRYTYGSSKLVKVECPLCGYVKKVSVSSLALFGFSCNKCSDGVSYPNKFMFNLLEQVGVEFIPEYSPDWIKPKRYDFYIPSKNLIIEMDGGFHYRHNNLSGLSSSQTKEIDALKDVAAGLQGILVMRINCDYASNDRFEIIKKNVINTLDGVLDFSNVDFDYLNKVSYESMLIRTVELFNSVDYSIKDIANIIKMSKSTVVNYLKAGTNMGLCEYNPKYSSHKVPLMIKENGMVFESISDLCKKSYELFGTELRHTSVSRAINNKTKYKGFTFIKI